jgi:5-methyltetrahydropteroyltriglutamate--homocysteine methyltransferase
MARSMNLGMPRIGPRRELKRAIESYWAGTTDAATLADVARARRAASWREQAEAGIDSIPSNDFSLYDQVLDTTCLVGAVPARFGPAGGAVDLDTYFALARGTSGAAPLEMTKWFDTNYHYLVPELGPDTTFTVSSTKPVDEYTEARALGLVTRPVLLGPVTYLALSKSTVPGFSPLGPGPRRPGRRRGRLDRARRAHPGHRSGRRHRRGHRPRLPAAGPPYLEAPGGHLLLGPG